ncbi:MAG: hypothetical protein NXI32_14380 [bacterium]|nr:hypothetical protein [bacterium]
MSGALAADQFFQLVLEVDAQNKHVSATSTASEFADILELLADRGTSIAAPDFYAQDSMVLFSGGYKGAATVRALSPSAATITNANVALAEKILSKGPTRCFKRFGPNDLSVVTHISVANVSLLLGADLENTGDESFGWKAIFNSDSRPQTPSCFFKIAHHGSENADNRDIWEVLLRPNPLSVVTPFSKQKSPLPKDSDIDRIKRFTTVLLATTWPPSRKPPRRRGVDGIVASATRLRRATNRKTGFVRVRFDLREKSPKAAVSLFGSGCQL